MPKLRALMPGGKIMHMVGEGFTVVIVGRGSSAHQLAEKLKRHGFRTVGQIAAAQLLSFLDALGADGVIVAVVATGSLAELKQAEVLLQRLPPPQRPVALAVLSERTLAQFAPSRAIDDFVVWECSGEELAARLAVALWRRTGISGEGVIRSGELAVDVRQHRVVVSGREVHLTVREYDLLLALLQARGSALSRQQLLDQVWGADYLGGARTVDIHIRRLRAKMPEIAPRIVTVRGLGYRLEPADE